MAKKKKQTKKNIKAKKQISSQKGAKKKVVAAAQKKKEKTNKKIKPKTIAIIALTLLMVVVGLLQMPWAKQINLFSGNDNTISKEDRKPFPTFAASTSTEKIEFSDFVGSEACKSCHGKEYELWKKSTHGQAGGDPRSDLIIGKFDGKTRKFADATVTPQKVSGKYQFRFQPEGMTPETFQVDAVVGGGHMIGGGSQTYFSRFPDGTMRFLPFDFIRNEQVWFGETDKGEGWVPITEELSIDDLSEWPPSRILGAHYSLENCQECHGSQIQVQYNLDDKIFETKYTSLAINCESCHGPGKKHVELALSGAIDTATDIGMIALATLGKDESLEVCFRCHALKDALDPGYLQGDDLEAHYGLKLPMLGETPYHPDGRIRAFGYQQNHLFSDCYISGSMTCVDCHDPHSQDYRDLTGKPLADPFDDGQCTGCHGSKALDIELHTHHPVGSEGSKCVSCHMPYLQHQAMGAHLQFARSDHTIPIPRPAFDEALGIENACSKCHGDKTVEWLAQKTKEWYGEIKPHKEIVTNMMKVKPETDRKSAGTLLLNGSTVHYVGHMAGLGKFVQNYIEPDMVNLESEIVDKIKDFVSSSDLDVKSLAMVALHLAQDKNPAIHNYLADQLASLSEEEQLKVRRRWGVMLPYLGEKFEKNGEPQKAITAYKRALEILPNNKTILTHLGYTYQSTGDLQNALSYYQQSIQADPSDAMGWVNLGNIQQNLGEQLAAFEAYEKAVAINPWNAIAHFNIGNYYYRAKILEEAISYYEKTIALDPAISEAYFNLTKAYIQTKAYRKALNTVRAGLRFDPKNTTGLQMLNDLEKALGNIG